MNTFSILYTTEEFTLSTTKIVSQTTGYHQNNLDRRLVIFKKKITFCQENQPFFNTSRTLLIEEGKGNSDVVTRVLVGCSCPLKANLHAFSTLLMHFGLKIAMPLTD